MGFCHRFCQCPVDIAGAVRSIDIVKAFQSVRNGENEVTFRAGFVPMTCKTNLIVNFCKTFFDLSVFGKSIHRVCIINKEQFWCFLCAGSNLHAKRYKIAF